MDRSHNSSSIIFFDLLSLAFIFLIEYPTNLAANSTLADLPIPGGPETKHAQAFTLGASAQLPPHLGGSTYFFIPYRTTLSQS